MKDACNLLIELYATKLTKRDLLDACLIWRNKRPGYELGAPESEECKHYTMVQSREATKRFIEPVFESLKTKEEPKFKSYYQYTLHYLLRSAIDKKIMNNDGQILDKKQFVNEVLAKCVLPDDTGCMTLSSDMPAKFLFHSLTGLDFAHIILEQINHVDTSDYATQYKESIKQNGMGGDFYTLLWAISDCREPGIWNGYRPFVTDDDIHNAVGTDLQKVLNLCKTIVSRMTANVKH